jgi:SpoU rRNA methylase family enzyme
LKAAVVTPPVRLTRKGIVPFEITGEESQVHFPWIDNFCLHCGADLFVLRSLVDSTAISFAERYLLLVAQSAERALHCAEKSDMALMLYLGISLADQARLTELYCEALEPSTVLYCGLEYADVGGISADGTFLYTLCVAPETPRHDAGPW